MPTFVGNMVRVAWKCISGAWKGGEFDPVKSWKAHETGEVAEAAWSEYETAGASPTTWADLET